jgi:hypothetical protein
MLEQAVGKIIIGISFLSLLPLFPLMPCTILATIFYEQSLIDTDGFNCKLVSKMAKL